jgi:putative FmdB family regulatory protein
MPVYEYYCQACDHEWEREQRIHDAPVKACPRCKARKAKRMISRTSFVLKGSGWYSDLYSSAKGGGKDEAKADSDTSSAGKSEGATGDSGDKDSGGKSAGDKGADKKGSGEKSGSGGDKKPKKSGPGSKAAA